MSEKFVNSVLYVSASAELQEQIEKELEIADPKLEVAESAILENVKMEP